MMTPPGELRPPDAASDAGEPVLGVVIPTLDEEASLPGLLDDLERTGIAMRVVVVDGGSTDRTREIARDRGAEVLVETPPGRARQLGVGVARLETPWLLLIHADCRLGPPAREALRAWLEAPGPEGAAHFRFRLDATGAWWTAIELGQRIRESVTGLTYGDQGLIVSRERLDGVGGVPEVPLMEDVELVRRLRRTGGVRRLPAPVVTSARRYRDEGPFRAWLRNASLISLHLLGASPERLARRYLPRRGNGARADRLLLIFAKRPDPGRVKTRLAGELGAEGAAELYRRLGRLVLDRVRGGPYRTIVCFDPPGARDEVAAWLGEEGGVAYRPQPAGDLGERMAGAFDEAFAEARRVVIVGTDAPDLDARLVEEAFEALERPGGPELVLGPARDGGYYLIGLRRPTPALFRNVPWSTPEVTDVTLDRARAEGLAWDLLRPLVDVDRPEDVPAGLRALSEAS